MKVIGLAVPCYARNFLVFKRGRKMYTCLFFDQLFGDVKAVRMVPLGHIL